MPVSEKRMILTAVLVIWNIVTFLIMGIDKYKARKGKWRISERALLLSGAAFGACGAFLGMIIFHHKTKRLYFWLAYSAFSVLQIMLLILLLLQGR